MPRNALDVLAQQIVACCCERPRGRRRDRGPGRAAPTPTRASAARSLGAVLDMLSGALSPAPTSPTCARACSPGTARATRSPRAGAPRWSPASTPARSPTAATSACTWAPSGPRVGELDEEMVFETRGGDLVLLGATTWRVEEITRDRVIVSPAPGEPGRLPFWSGEGPGRPLELGRAVGRLLREAGRPAGGARPAWMRRARPLDEPAAANLAAYVRRAARGHRRRAQRPGPSWSSVFATSWGTGGCASCTPFGAARARALGAWRCRPGSARRRGFETQVMYTDDGIVLRVADGEDLPSLPICCRTPTRWRTL